MHKLWQRYVAAMLALLAALASWQLEAELLQGIQEPSSPNYYQKPWFLVWFLSGGYIAFIPVWLIIRIFKLSSKGFSFTACLSQRNILIGPEDFWVVKVATFLSVPYFFSGYFWFISIDHTSVTANTAIFDSSFIFIFLLSIFLLKEQISFLKIASVVVSFAGLMVVVWSGSESSEDGVDQTVGGYLLVSLATIFYAIFEVGYKKYGTMPTSNEETPSCKENLLELADMNLEDIVGEHVESTGHGEIPLESSFLFLGVTGAATILLYWPGLIALDYLGWEIFEIPNSVQTGLLGVNMVLDAVNNITLLLAISWTTPMFVGMGSLLNIPISVALDVLIHSYLLPWTGFAGVVGIVLGFLLLALADLFISHSSEGEGTSCSLVHCCTGAWNIRRK